MPRIHAASIEVHKAQTRRQILDAAGLLFSRVGYDQASFASIADLVGVGRTTIYQYFKDKDDLLASLVEEELPRALDKLVGWLPAVGPAQRLGTLLRSFIIFLATDHHLGPILMRDAPKLSDQAQQRVSRSHESLRAELERLYAEGVAAGELREVPGPLVGMLAESAMRAARRSTEAGLGAELVAEQVVEILLNGVSTRANAS